MNELKAPFPYFGGKRRVANIVWKRFEDIPNYVEPFAGSLAVLLGRPYQHLRERRFETVNDKDAFVENFWRALKSEPDMLSKWCDWPVNEAALHSRHKWLFQRRKELTGMIMSDPDYYDVKVAGWWVWGICMWIGSGWCDKLYSTRPHLGRLCGVHRRGMVSLEQYLRDLSTRLRHVRVCCGSWERVLGSTLTKKLRGVTGVFLDPPYGASRTTKIYNEDDSKLYLKVRDWAIEHGNNPKLRIALCGYTTELDDHMPDNWERVRWKATGGFAALAKSTTKGKDNSKKEVIWFSPHCINTKTHLGLLGRSLQCA